jgi:ATP-binding cassette subfamily B protein
MAFFGNLAAEAYDRAYSDRQIVQRLVRYFSAERSLLFGGLGTVLVLTVIGLLDPIIVSRGLDAIKNNPTRNAVFVLVGVLLLFAVLNWLSILIRRRLTARLIANTVSALRRDAFTATIGHDMSFFDKYQSGKIISRITGDTQEISQVVTLLSDFISQFTILIVLVIYLLSVSWQLTLALLAMAPVLFLCGAGLRALARRVTRTGFRAIGEVNASIQEAVAGMRVAKNFRQEAAIYEGFTAVNNRSYDVNLKRGFVLSNVFPITNTLAGFATGLMVYAGGFSVSTGAVTFGAWYLFIVSLDRFWFPMTNLTSFWSQIQGGLSACERIFALIDAEPTVKQRLEIRDWRLGQSPISNLQSPISLRGEIEFKQVDFRYNEQQQVLKDFSLCINPGESVAFVGHTGAGKSSVIKLITRFYEFQAGEILIDGQDIRTFDLSQYRRQLGLVSQSPFLFAGTVLENIRYAAPHLSDADVEAVAMRIGNGEWLDTLSNGLQTEVGERGNRLSMGQRQLVALARVLAQKPPIFILDEATASVDPFTESQIQAALNLILSESTSILIAHRLSTVKSADRIIALDHGQIIEEGNHDQLMSKGGYYAELYRTYFRHQSLEYRVVNAINAINAINE